MTTPRDAVLGRLRHPRTTVRWRLTLLYGGLFLVCGAVLLAVTYTLVDHAPVTRGPSGLFIRSSGSSTTIQPTSGSGSASGGGAGVAASASLPPPVRQSFQKIGTQTEVHGRVNLSQLPPQLQKALSSQAGQVAIRIVGANQRIADLHSLVIESAIALAIMAIISAALGWVVAGRVLRPLRTMTTATQEISEASLHRRLAMAGPQDELRQLADTIDGLLGRLEGAFDAQRRFVANASHELRTPLTSARALLEMVLSDPRATVTTFRTTCRQVLEESEQQEQLIDALLALAQSERGIDRHEVVNLAEVVAAALQAQTADASEREVRMESSLRPARLSGDRRLIDRLVANLVQNALRHNIPGGWVRATVDTTAGGAAELRVLNTGPPVPADQVERLLQPFQRLGADRAGYREGVGLGLSIVSAIAAAHHAVLDVRPGQEGGLDVRVRFPEPMAGVLPALDQDLRERSAGEERAQGAGMAAHAQGPVGVDLEAGAHDDLDRPVLPAGDPADGPLDLAGQVETAPQEG